MRVVGLFLISSVLSNLSLAAGYRMEAAFHPESPEPGKIVTLRFSLFADGSTSPLKSGDLELEHERRIHLLVLDAGFLQYRHEHPEEVSPGVWEQRFQVDKAGDYRFWAQFKQRSERHTQTVAVDRKISSSAGQSVPREPVDKKIRPATTVDGYDVRMVFPKGEPVPHAMTEIAFEILKDGKPLAARDLDPYLGAKLHVIGVSADRNDLMHAHPGHEDRTNELAISGHFMQSGFYGIFLQFSHQGLVRTAQLSLEVKER